MNLYFLEVKNRCSLGIDHVFEAQQEGQDQVKGKARTEGCERQVDKEKPHTPCPHPQFVAKSGRHVKSVTLKKMPQPGDQFYHGTNITVFSFRFSVLTSKIFGSTSILFDYDSIPASRTPHLNSFVATEPPACISGIGGYHNNAFLNEVRPVTAVHWRIPSPGAPQTCCKYCWLPF